MLLSWNGGRDIGALMKCKERKVNDDNVGDGYYRYDDDNNDNDDNGDINDGHNDNGGNGDKALLHALLAVSHGHDEIVKIITY